MRLEGGVRGEVIRDRELWNRVVGALSAELPVERLPPEEVPPDDGRTVLLVVDDGRHQTVLRYRADLGRVFVREDGIAFPAPPALAAVIAPLLEPSSAAPPPKGTATPAPVPGPDPVGARNGPTRAPPVDLPPALRPQDAFDLQVRYGVGARNVLDTASGTFTKDLAADPPVTVPLRLTRDELARIYAEMVRIRFFDYPARFEVQVSPGTPVVHVNPASAYVVRVSHNGRVAEVAWIDWITNPDPRADRLRGWLRTIIAIVEQKDEYKRAPTPRGGYL